jgi:soluble lytic murein transglycosylase-like protein
MILRLSLIIVALLACMVKYNCPSGYYVYRDFYPTLDRETYEASKAACGKYGIDQRLHIAIGWRESRLKNVVSYKDGRDYGIFQVRDVHCKDNPKKLLDIRYNAEISAKILYNCINRSNGNIKFALVRYNAGINCNLGVYRHWRTYVLKIIDMYNTGVI